MGLLRKIFGPSKEEIWRQLCHELGGEFVEGGFWKGDSKVRVRVKEWTITLDTYTVSTGKTSVTYTRMRAPYVNKDDFRFITYRKNWFSNIAKWLGMQDIPVGNPKVDHLQPMFGVPGYLNAQDIDVGHDGFDQDFIIKSNSEVKVQALFANPKIRQLMRSQPEVYLAVKDDEGWFGADFAEGVDELYFQVVGVIKEVERLKALYELFAEVLNQLCHIGSAYEDDPKLVI